MQQDSNIIKFERNRLFKSKILSYFIATINVTAQVVLLFNTIDYIIAYFENNNQNLVNQNKKLDFENKKLKELNNKLSSSNKSDKLHTTFGFLKNLKK